MMSDLTSPKRRSKRLYSPLGEYLAANRKRIGLTQRQVAEALDYSSPQFISNFERGVYVPPLNKLHQLTNLYGLAVNDILDVVFACERDRIRKALGHKEKPKKK